MPSIFLSQSQEDIMNFVDRWAREKKTPIPLAAIKKEMKVQGKKVPATIWAINALLKKGYMRRAVVISNKTYFVQLRRV